MFEDPDIQTLIRTFRDYAGYDFNNYSEKSFLRRIEKVMMDYKLDIRKLIAKVKDDRLFLEQVVRDITVNTTELFRDPQVWHAIKYRILPRLASKRDVFHAMENAFGEGQEMVLFLSELNAGYYSLKYINECGNDEYYRFNKLLLLKERNDALRREILTLREPGRESD